MIIAVIVSLVMIFASDNYLNLITSNNKILYSLINGKSEKFKMFFNILFKYFMPFVIAFLLGLNYYLAKLTYLFFAYQFSLFVMTISAMIDVYGFTGIITGLLLVVPVNLIFFVDFVFFSAVCIERAELSSRTKFFKEGFDRYFFIKIMLAILMLILLAFFVAFVFPLVLKSSIFYIY